MKKPQKVIIVGGVAGGASCAARLRRLDERSSITIYDRSPFVSLANCGLPYHVGGVIPNEASLLLASPLQGESYNLLQTELRRRLGGLVSTPTRTLRHRHLTGKHCHRRGGEFGAVNRGGIG
jgi:flavin-dependent dehydrogenase